MEETPNTEEVPTNEVEEQQSVDAPTEEAPAPEETPESPETPEAPAEEPEVAAEAEEEKPPSRREQLRIQQVLEKLKQKDSRPEAPVKPDALNYSDLDADPELVKQLEADRRKYGEDLYTQGVEQSKSILFHTRLEVDAPRVEAKYPQLDKDSDQFDPAIANALNSSYLHLVGYDEKTDTVQNPGIRYADYIEAQFELANAIASEKVVKTSKNIAKQAASTGLRPDGSTAKRLNLNQNAEDMTDEELQAKIAQSLPK